MVTWLPFELNPAAPVEGIPREVYFGRARSEQMESRLQTIAKSVGLEMHQREVIINSRRALGAAELARERGLFDEMHHALLKEHWEGTGRLEDVDDLVRIGTGVGLDAAELRTTIAGQQYDAGSADNRRAPASAGRRSV